MSLYDIDGTDSSGKQTVTDLVAKKLQDLGKNVRKVAFPQYHSQTSSLVKMYLEGSFGKQAGDVNPYTASTFYAVDRAGSYLSDWKKDYEAGTIILCDRYIGSNAIYQTAKIDGLRQKRNFLQWLRDLEMNKMELPTPNKTFFLHMPLEKSVELMKNRLNEITGAAEKDIYERDDSFMKKAYDSARWVASEWNWQEVLCVNDQHELRNIEEIAEEVVAAILKNEESLQNKSIEKETDCMLNSWAVRGEITMVSKEKQEKKFDYASPGGFHVLLKAEQKDAEDFVLNERKKVAFDWSQSEGYYEKLEDGRGQIAWILSDFDKDFFIESNKEEGILVPDWSTILEGVLNEAYYDVGFTNPETQEEESVEMELVDFHIIGEGINGEEVVMSFTSEQIAYCNELAKKRFEPIAN